MEAEAEYPQQAECSRAAIKIPGEKLGSSVGANREVRPGVNKYPGDSSQLRTQDS
jgi:hypothetical protein